MLTNWDFRSILDVYPDGPGFTCVGTTKKGARCGQWMIANSDKARAVILLNEMDTLSKLSMSYKYLEELAELTLCPRWHRDTPGHGQVRQVCIRWRAEIAAFKAEMEREKEKAAMIKSKRALAKLRKDVSDVKVKLEEEEVSYKASNSSPLTSEIVPPTMKSAPEVKEAMLFTSPIPKPSLAYITPPSSVNNTPSRNVQQNIHEKVTSSNTHISVPQSNNHCPPSPPDSLLSKALKQEQSPLATPTKASPQASQQQQNFTITKTSSIEVIGMADPSDTAPKTNSQEKTKIQAISFGFYPTPDTTPQPHSKDDPTGTADASNIAYLFGAGKQVPPPVFDIRVADKMPNSTPSSLPSTTSLEAMSVFNFNITTKSFEFGTPTKLSSAMQLPEKSSTAWNDLNTRTEKKLSRDYWRDEADTSPQPRNKIHLSPGPKLSITPPSSSGADPFLSAPQPKQIQDRPKPPVRKSSLRARFGFVTPEATPGPPQCSTEVEQVYGYAIITSTTTTRYKTYLPSAQQHSNMTPPSTPESRSGILQDLFWPFTSTPSPQIAILRKPLPPPPTRETQLETCEACGVEECKCHCDEDSENEDERVGCLHSSRLRRLRKMVARKVTIVKKRVSGSLSRHREPDRSKDS